MPIEWRSPANLFLLGLLVPLVLLYVLKVRRQTARVPSTWLWRTAERDLLAKQPFRRIFPHVSLLLEALALLALALAYAGPALRGGQLDTAHLAIVIDASASMGTLGPEKRPRIDLAREAALAAIRRLPPGADALVIESGRQARIVGPLERDRRRIEAAVRRVRATEAQGDLGRALSLASDHLRARPGKSRIWVVTDGALAEADAFELVSLPVDVERVGSPTDNAAIVRVDAARVTNDTGSSEVQVFALIANFGRSPLSSFVTLRQRNSTTPLATRRLDLAPGEQAPAVLSFASSSRDEGMGLVVELSPGDALAADDRAYLRVPVGQRLTVVMAPKTASPWLARAFASDPDVELFGAALGDLGPKEVPHDAFLVVEGGCPKRLPGGDFLLVNPPEGECLGVKVGAAVERPEITSWSEHDPRFRFTTFDGVLVRRASRLEVDGPRTALVSAREGVLVADVSGAGRTGTLLGFDVGESNWPLRASFVLFTRNLLELARNHRAGAETGPVSTGDPLPLRVPLDVAEVELERPGGDREKLPAREGIVVAPSADRAGLYYASWQGLRPGSTLVPVNLTSAAESDLRERELQLPAGRPVAETAKSRAGDAVSDWSWPLFALALALVLADILWVTRKPRMGLDLGTARPSLEPLRGGR